MLSTIKLCRYSKFHHALSAIVLSVVMLMRLYHPLDGIANANNKLLRFLANKFFGGKEKRALTFNRDRCCHLALCLRLILFHYLNAEFHYAECCYDVYRNNTQHNGALH
jgi:hypothetical protein